MSHIIPISPNKSLCRKMIWTGSSPPEVDRRRADVPGHRHLRQDRQRVLRGAEAAAGLHAPHRAQYCRDRLGQYVFINAQPIFNLQQTGSQWSANGQPTVSRQSDNVLFQSSQCLLGGGGALACFRLAPRTRGGEGGWITASPNLAGRNPSTRGEPVENCFQWPKFFPKCWDPHLPQMPTFGHFGIIFWNRITPPQTAEFPLGAQRWRNLFQFGNPPQLPPPQGRVV